MKSKSTNYLAAALTFLCLISYSLNLQAQEEKPWSSTPCEVKDISSSSAILIKAEVPMAEIGSKMGETYQKLFDYMAKNSIKPAGPAFAIYHSWDPNGNVVFEAGIPVNTEVKTTDEIKFKSFNEMKAVTTLYTGAYENMEPVYNKLMAFMEDESLESTGVSWEVYLTSPAEVDDPSKLQTLIYFPIK